MCLHCHTSCNSITACVRQEPNLTCPTGLCRRTYKWCKCRVACACGEPAYHAWQLLLLLATNQVHQWTCQCCGQLAVSNRHGVPNLPCATSSSIFKLSMQHLLSHSRMHCTPSCKLGAHCGVSAQGVVSDQCQDVRYLSDAGKFQGTCLTKKVAIVRCCSNTFKSLLTLAFAAACTPFHNTLD